MLVIAGWTMVFAAIFGGYALEGGHLAAMMQPVELLMIAGGAFGAFLVGNSTKALKATFKALPSVFGGAKYNKAKYLQVLSLLYEILLKVRKDGFVALERDIDDPASSPIFSKYTGVISDRHVIDFITDYLRLMVGGNMNAFEIESLMDQEIETHHKEAEVPAHALTKVGDGLPAFGIVAAVMGVAHTMESIDKPPMILGALIAKALVGTFLGILLAYGIVGPLGTALEHKVLESSKVYDCIKATLLASLNGYAPQVAVEFGRKVLFASERPSFNELETSVRQLKVK